jgi:hypothetical protein
MTGCHAHRERHEMFFLETLNRSRGHVCNGQRDATCPCERVSVVVAQRSMALAMGMAPMLNDCD